MKYLALILAVIPLFYGCSQKQKTSEPQMRVVTIPEAAKIPVDGIGGESAWSNTQVILGDATAKFYRPDGTFYVTRQRHAIYPWSDTIRIYDQELQGRFVWQLSRNQYGLWEGNCQQESMLPIQLSNEHIARAIWSLMASPAAVATEAPGNAQFAEATRVEGLWHYPMELNNGQMLYMSRDTSRFDIYTTVTQNPAILMARGYDYRTIEKNKIAVPSKIEIFTADSITAQPHKIVEFDYKQLQSFGF